MIGGGLVANLFSINSHDQSSIRGLMNIYSVKLFKKNEVKQKEAVVCLAFPGTNFIKKFFA